MKTELLSADDSSIRTPNKAIYESLNTVLESGDSRETKITTCQVQLDTIPQSVLSSTECLKKFIDVTQGFQSDKKYYNVDSYSQKKGYGFFVRSCYVELYQQLLVRTGQGDFNMSVLGTSGVGKTNFASYFISKWCYSLDKFSPRDSICLIVKESSLVQNFYLINREHINDSTNKITITKVPEIPNVESLIIYDGHLLTEVSPAHNYKLILTSCGNFPAVGKSNPMSFFIPNWNKEELEFLEKLLAFKSLELKERRQPGKEFTKKLSYFYKELERKHMKFQMIVDHFGGVARSIVSYYLTTYQIGEQISNDEESLIALMSTMEKHI